MLLPPIAIRGEEDTCVLRLIKVFSIASINNLPLQSVKIKIKSVYLSTMNKPYPLHILSQHNAQCCCVCC